MSLLFCLYYFVPILNPYLYIFFSKHISKSWYKIPKHFSFSLCVVVNMGLFLEYAQVFGGGAVCLPVYFIFVCPPLRALFPQLGSMSIFGVGLSSSSSSRAYWIFHQPPATGHAPFCVPPCSCVQSLLHIAIMHSAPPSPESGVPGSGWRVRIRKPACCLGSSIDFRPVAFPVLSLFSAQKQNKARRRLKGNSNPPE